MIPALPRLLPSRSSAVGPFSRGLSGSWGGCSGPACLDVPLGQRTVKINQAANTRDSVAVGFTFEMILLPPPLTCSWGLVGTREVLLLAEVVEEEAPPPPARLLVSRYLRGAG